MPRFVMVSVHSGVPWPATDATVQFDEQSIRLIPPRAEDRSLNISAAHPMAVIEYEAGADEKALVQIIRRFLNGLSWRDQSYIREIDVTYGAPLRTGTRWPDNSTTNRFDPENIPNPSDKKARIALALYREGLALERIHIGYSFLSFYKVINIRFKNGSEQKQWINKSVQNLQDQDSNRRLEEIRQDELDIGKYLYESGRCAVAHAFDTPVVDPDEIVDQQRLSRDKPVIRGLAALLIQNEWGISAPAFRAAV